MITALRAGGTADLESILTIQQASLEAAQWNAEEWCSILQNCEKGDSKNLRSGYHAWVADGGPAVLGFIVGLFSGEEFEILNIAVAPEGRRTGIASQLLKEALEAARLSGGQRVYLEVRASNAGAIAFYERQGFLPFGLRHNYYRAPIEDALVLSRKL